MKLNVVLITYPLTHIDKICLFLWRFMFFVYASIKASRQLLVWPYSKQIFNNLNCTDNLVLQFANCAQFWSAREWLSISMKSKGLYQFIIFVPGNPLTNNFWWSWKNSWRELFEGINKGTWWFDTRCQIWRFTGLWLVVPIKTI